MNKLNFTGTGFEYFKIWIVNILLTIVTLGLYSPWAKVRSRRYFYANANLNDRTFEYHATGKQLFIAFLIAMVFFVLYTILTEIAPLFSLWLIAVLFLVLPWLIWKSLIFNMKVTSFSNVHFAFKGSLGLAYINFFVLPILLMALIYAVPIFIYLTGPFDVASVEKMFESVSVSFYIVGAVLILLAFYLMSYTKKRNAEYIINGLRYGQGKFETTLMIKEFIIINVKAVALFLGSLSFLMGLSMLLIGSSDILAIFTDLKNGTSRGVFAIFIYVYFLTLFIIMVVMSYVVARQRKYIYENIKLDDKITFESTLSARRFAWVMVSNVLMVIFTVGFAFPWAKVRMARLILDNTLVDTSGGFDEYISQKQDEISSLGDQIGDAFDAGVDVGF